MTSLLRACEWLNDLAISTRIRESDNVFSLIETVHVLGIVSVLGTIAIADLRLLGVLLQDTPVEALTRPLIRMTWYGFALMFASGALLFAAQAQKLYYNTAFRVKLFLLLLIAANLIVFHTTVYRKVRDWNLSLRPPPRARAAAFVSLLLWSGVIVSGRAIAYLYTH